MQRHFDDKFAGSHPLRVRGLKHLHLIKMVIDAGSHPLRVRGLKHYAVRTDSSCLYVAPLAGAWIETRKTDQKDVKESSRTPCGCVD